jgi:hypothetical protein
LSLLPGTHAVLFVLAADTGVTQSDRDLATMSAMPRPPGGAEQDRWPLGTACADWEIEAEIARQARSCAQILDLPTNRIFAVSAREKEVAKVNGDTGRTAQLPRLEDAATGLLPAKRDIVAGGAVVEPCDSARRQLLATRPRHCHPDR